MPVTIEELAARYGYRTAKAKEIDETRRIVTLKKGDRIVMIDDELVADIEAMVSPVENQDASTSSSTDGIALSFIRSDEAPASTVSLRSISDISPMGGMMSFMSCCTCPSTIGGTPL